MTRINYSSQYKTQQVPGFTAVHYWAILNKQIALLLIV
jgi:hypothetical protein